MRTHLRSRSSIGSLHRAGDGRDRLRTRHLCRTAQPQVRPVVSSRCVMRLEALSGWVADKLLADHGRVPTSLANSIGSDAVATLGPAGARSHPAASRCRGAASARTACTHGGSHWRSAPLRVERSPSDPFKPSMGLLRRPTPGKIVGPLRAKSWRADDAAGPAGRARIRAHLRKSGYGYATRPTFPHYRICR